MSSGKISRNKYSFNGELLLGILFCLSAIVNPETAIEVSPISAQHSTAHHISSKSSYSKTLPHKNLVFVGRPVHLRSQVNGASTLEKHKLPLYSGRPTPGTRRTMSVTTVDDKT